MNAVEQLAAEQARNGKPNPMDAAEELTVLLDLPSVGLSVRGAQWYGRGSTASVDLHLSDNTAIEFRTVRDVSNPTRLACEVAACTSATPRLKAPQAMRAVALLRALAEHHATATLDQLAAEWGVSYLQVAEVLDLDLNDQRERWGAFEHLASLDPIATSRHTGESVAKSSTVLRHTDGARLVRCGWFCAHARREDPAASPQEVALRMMRVGWTRRGTTGRVKATHPTMPKRARSWTFYLVPAGWEEGVR